MGEFLTLWFISGCMGLGLIIHATKINYPKVKYLWPLLLLIWLAIIGLGPFSLAGAVIKYIKARTNSISLRGANNEQ